MENNFYYVAQKYFIYYIFLDIIEDFSDVVENEVNENIYNLLLNHSNIFDWFKNLYTEKVNNLNEIFLYIVVEYFEFFPNIPLQNVFHDNVNYSIFNILF